HQSFVGGRTATMRDVQIDAIGFCGAVAVLTAFFALAAFGRSICRRKRNSAFSGGIFEASAAAAVVN
ncbi:MAG: VanZ family protein, partial [Treponemataceae bacterium]|nr:VanZ family protein [Treponemataceae bacterium]